MNLTDTLWRRGLVICVSGPSGVGKGTVIRRMRELRPDLALSISVTTREPRPGERDGVEYYFRSAAEFRQMLAEGEILESDCYCGNSYGTPRTPLENMVRRGVDVLMDITVPGSLSVLAKYPDVITVFLLPPSFSELRRRLETRGTEDPAVIDRRLGKAREEIGKAGLFQYNVINADVDGAANSILAIIEAEHCRQGRLPKLEEAILTH